MQRFILSFAVCCVLSCQKQTISTSEIPGEGGVIVYNVNKNTLLTLVNNVRKSGCMCGTTNMPAVDVVTWNDQLAQAAYAHSNDMQTQNYFSHTAKNGSDPGTRIRNAGYQWRTYGENIALGYRNEQEVMNGWLESEGHCRNIMNPNFREMGVGREGDYWTQEFGTR